MHNGFMLDTVGAPLFGGGNVLASASFEPPVYPLSLSLSLVYCGLLSVTLYFILFPALLQCAVTRFVDLQF